MSTDQIQRHSFVTKNGNSLAFFYNPANNLVCVDVVASDETCGYELLRTTLKEEKLLEHCRGKTVEKVTSHKNVNNRKGFLGESTTWESAV